MQPPIPDTIDASTGSQQPTRERTDEAVLIIVHSPDQGSVGRRIPLGPKQECVFGRGTEFAPGHVEDPRMSRQHARVVWDPRAAAFRVGDGPSRNGTWLNGERQTTALITSGDVLRLGDTLFVMETKDTEAELFRRIEQFAPLEDTVLIEGETGTGKERTARALHELSGRTGPFVAVDCASFASDLIASELFGHVRGAFSQAVTARRGLLLSAEGGTILLDEIGELALQHQATLLRALQERRIRPVGSDRDWAVNVRVVAATNRSLSVEVEKATFRQDLHARLAQLAIRVPALRERRSRILAIAEQVIPGVPLTAGAAEILLLWRWPQNVRELRSVLRRYQALGGMEPMPRDFLVRELPHMMLAPESASARPPLPDRTALTALLAQHNGNVAALARELGESRGRLLRWMKRLGLSG